MTYPTNIDENAPVVADHTIRITASVERVWEIHTAIDAWPTWQDGVDVARLDGPVAPGSTFHWETAGLSIDSTVYAVEAPHRILWGGPAHGITGVHEWTFTQDGDEVVVHTRESWAGAPIDADRDYLAVALDDSLTAWLNALKKAAE
ncbi:SRPBCC family protein [Yinghuangia seranimata]|uniref:SRPBCC family protein n=1 Tax=Yinghuangia seranimata TaxID=408067 RepID=UPI00248BD080|nr:SRPBCC family protein [Yinghuangia seranimata]MDI2125044.1 SRPBCC family protein [Yinghuangia seranimata]